MLPIMAILGIMAATHSAGPTTEWKATNDPSVHYHWTLEPSWRPFCTVQVMDTSDSPNKRVSISYRNRSGSHVDLSVRMNPGDLQERVITGCSAIERVEIARR
jgi:hypothetical protein